MDMRLPIFLFRQTGRAGSVRRNTLRKEVPKQ